MRADRADSRHELQSAEETYFAEVQEAVRWSAEGMPPSPALTVPSPCLGRHARAARAGRC